MSQPDSTYVASMPIILRPVSPSDTTAITDALYRAVLGIDTNDASLFSSAFTISRTTPPSFTMFGKTHTGIDTLQAEVLDKVGKLDTTHFISNVRVTVYEESRSSNEAPSGKDLRSAQLTASAQAFHYRAGEGPDLEKRGKLVSGGLYDLIVVRDDDRAWRIQSWGIKIIWLEGDMAVMA